MPYQIEEEAGTAKALFFAEKVPGMGYKEYRVVAGEEQPKFSTDLAVSGLTLANSQVEVVIDPDSGNLKSLKKKGMETNFLREGQSRRGAGSLGRQARQGAGRRAGVEHQSWCEQ